MITHILTITNPRIKNGTVTITHNDDYDIFEVEQTLNYADGITETRGMYANRIQEAIKLAMDALGIPY